MFTLKTIDKNIAEEKLSKLTTLLIDSVSGGASVGFVGTNIEKDVEAYWLRIIQNFEAENRVLIIAETQEGLLVGTAQLELSPMPNGRHRGEIQKVLVHSQYRRKGLGKRLMERLEEKAISRQIKLLVLDTASEVAEKMYEKMGYIRVGEIPDYAYLVNGKLHPTSIFYKRLIY